LAATFSRVPADWAERVTGVFAALSDHADSLRAAIQALEVLVDETAVLLT
jgi:hypothetical protein